MPVNVKMVFEGMEESGSEGLEAVVRKEAGGFLKDVDAVCISDKRVHGLVRVLIAQLLARHQEALPDVRSPRPLVLEGHD